jgi:hypothetical protein
VSEPGARPALPEDPGDASTLRIPTHPPRAPRRRWPRVVRAAVLAVLVAGVWALASRTQEAVWFLAADQVPDPSSSTVTVLVDEVGCSSGERPSIPRPRVELGETTVTIAVRTRARLALGQSCPAVPPTPVTVDLGEPLGDRTLVDAYGDLDDAYGPIESYDPRLRAPAAAQR